MAHHGLCGVSGCETPPAPYNNRKNTFHPLCSYHRWRKDKGLPFDHVFFPNAGTWQPDQHGYMVRRFNGERQWEHREVMKEALGRDLYPGENVHHRNGVRSDNRISNLELWSVSQPSGQRVEDKIDWAKEFLAQYGFIVSRP